MQQNAKGTGNDDLKKKIAVLSFILVSPWMSGCGEAQFSLLG